LPGKYAIRLSATGVTGGGHDLNADWTNPLTPDAWTDDAPRSFVTGNATPNSENAEFRFHFSIMPGDYDGSGVVEGNDWALWQTTIGSTTNLQADGNGNGIIDIGDGDDDDISVWATHEGKVLPLFKLAGADYDDTERVSYDDFVKWAQAWTVNANGDGDNDSDVQDFWLYQYMVGNQSV
jgi:hypothetical protein